MTTTPVHMPDCQSCRHKTHEPETCAHENGCAGCTGCPTHDGDVSIYCVECGHWTVHPDRHEHDKREPESMRMGQLSGVNVTRTRPRGKLRAIDSLAGQ